MTTIKFTRHGLVYQYLCDTSTDVSGEYVPLAEYATLAASLRQAQDTADALQAKVDALILFINGKITEQELEGRIQ
jgi:hypothetical protein